MLQGILSVTTVPRNNAENNRKRIITEHVAGSSAYGEWLVHNPKEWYVYHGTVGFSSGFKRTMGANSRGLALQ
jgi:hypothetical protein